MLYMDGPEAVANCLVQRSSWKNAPAADPDCDLDWIPNEAFLTSGFNNNEVAVSTVSVGACRGDIGPLCGPDCKVLKYGAKATVGNIRCTSTKRGVTCETIKGLKRSFTVSAASFKIVR